MYACSRKLTRVVVATSAAATICGGPRTARNEGFERKRTFSFWQREKTVLPLRWNSPLSSRYTGTRAARSVRAKQLMSDREVSTVAHLINDLVDLECFDEDEEQEIFEFAVCRLVEKLADCLPNEYIFQVHSEKTMCKEDAKKLDVKLTKWLNQQCDLPFLDDADQRRIVRCVLALLMRSMRKPRSQVGELSNLEKHKLVFDVFVKGALEVFYEESRKAELVKNVEKYCTAIPFVPHWLIGLLCDMLLSHASERCTPVLSDTFDEYLLRVEEDPQILLSSDATFTALLRHNFGVVFMRDVFENSVGFLRLVSFLSTNRVERCALLFVDSFLDSIDAKKLDEIMLVVAKDNVMRRGLICENAFEAEKATNASTTTFSIAFTPATRMRDSLATERRDNQ